VAERLPVAIAGAGLMGAWHAIYAQRCGATIVAVVDSNVEAGARLCARFPGSRNVTSVADLKHALKPKVLHICTPIESHANLALSALEAGMHVLVEKPLAGDAQVSRDLLSAAVRCGRVVMPVHQFLFQDGFRNVMARKAELGSILHIDATFCSAGATLVTNQDSDSVAAGILPHPLSLIERLVPGTLGAADWTVFHMRAGEWRVCGRANGLSISIVISLHGRPTECAMRIITEDGAVDLDLFHGFAIVDRASVSRAAKIARPFRTATARFGQAGWNLARRLVTRQFAYPGLNRLIAEFYHALDTGSSAPIAPEEIIAIASARDQIVDLAHP